MIFMGWATTLAIGVSCHEPPRAQPSTPHVPLETAVLDQSPDAQRDIVDLTPWAEVLTQVVRGEDVLYSKLQRGEARQTLERFIKTLEAPLPQLLAPEARLAYWINAYNALTLRHVVRYPGLKSVAEVPEGSPRYTFFKQKAHRVAGRLRSLDDIEHKILRPIFKDPRIHAALNCASRSCPPLAPTPYRAAMIHQQLNEASARFVNDSTRNELTARPPQLSKIFEWFAEDFSGEARSREAGVSGFIRRFAKPTTLKQSVFSAREGEAQEELVLTFKPYDWSLNGPAPIQKKMSKRLSSSTLKGHVDPLR